MIGCARSRIYSHIVTICIFSFLLAVVWPAAVWSAAAAGQGSDPDDGGAGVGIPGSVTIPTPTPTPRRDNVGGPTPTPKPKPNPTPPLSNPPTTLTELEIRAALAPNRIVFHPATPVQLCKVDDGLQVYFIGADGKTYFGPWVPPFAELAATYPEGESASIYSGPNPLSGKQVDIDYLPSKQKLRVSTYYADRPPHAIDKPYVYTVDHLHNITHEQW